MCEVKRRTHAVSAETSVLNFFGTGKMLLCSSDDSVRNNSFCSRKSNFDHVYAHNEHDSRAFSESPA